MSIGGGFLYKFLMFLNLEVPPSKGDQNLCLLPGIDLGSQKLYVNFIFLVCYSTVGQQMYAENEPSSQIQNKLQYRIG